MSISAPASTSFTNLIPYQLLLEKRQRQKEQKLERYRQIEELYGEAFTKIVGAKTISSLPAKDFKDPVTPSMLQNCSAARTILFRKNDKGDECPLPGVLIKVDLLDPITQEKVDTVVEIIFQCYCYGGGKSRCMEDNFVTALNNISELNKSYPSTLYSFGGRSKDIISAVAQLLEGEIIKTPYTTYLVRMAEN